MLKRMKKKMRYFIFPALMFLLAAPQWSTAEISPDSDIETIDIGNALILEISPAKYETYIDNSSCDALAKNTTEWVTIPAVFETITEPVIVQKAYTDVKVSPPAYKTDGSIETAAKAELIEIPAVTRQVSRRVVKIPARQVKRTIPNMCHPSTARRLVKPKSFTIKEEWGTVLYHFDTPEALADYLNGQ